MGSPRSGIVLIDLRGGARVTRRGEFIHEAPATGVGEKAPARLPGRR